MATRRVSATWQEGVVAGLAVVLALTGAVTVLVRNSETSGNSNDLAKALKGLTSLTTVSSAPQSTNTTAPPFVAQDAGFSAEFPVEPQRTEQPLQTAGVSLQQIIYVATTADEVVGAGGAIVPVTPTGKALQAGLDGAVNGAATKLSGTVVSRNTLTYVGVEAEDGVVTTTSSGVIRVRVLFKARRIYVLLGITEKTDTPHPDYDRLLATFQTL